MDGAPKMNEQEWITLLAFAKETMEQPRLQHTPDITMLKRLGNEAYARGDYSAAIRMYSRGLRAASKANYPQQIVAILYTNRCAALQALEKYDIALRDATEAVYEDATYAKGWFRRALLLEQLQSPSEIDASIARQLVEAPFEGRKMALNRVKAFQEASPAVHQKDGTEHGQPLRLARDDRKGRGWLAQAQIGESTTVIREEPFVLVRTGNIDHICSYCLNEGLALIRCPTCSDEMYCSRVCRSSAWMRWHAKECGKVKCCEDDPELRLAMRMCWIENDGIRHLQQHPPVKFGRKNLEAFSRRVRTLDEG